MVLSSATTEIIAFNIQMSQSNSLQQVSQYKSSATIWQESLANERHFAKLKSANPVQIYLVS